MPGNWFSNITDIPPKAKPCNKAYKGEVKLAEVGLNIVKNLVELHNGEIKATNNKNKGAKIEINFPVA